MGKPLDLFAFFRPVFIAFCISKLFEHIILSRLFFFCSLASFSVLARVVSSLVGLPLIKFFIFLSTLQTGFASPSWALGQSLPLSTSLKLLTLSGALLFFAILFRLDFLVILFSKLSIFSFDRYASVGFQNHKSPSFQVWQGVVLDPDLIYLVIKDLPASQRSFISCSLFADNLAISFFWLWVPMVAEATQEALIRPELWSEQWCLPLNPGKCEALFFSPVTPCFPPLSTSILLPFFLLLQLTLLLLLCRYLCESV